MADKKLNTGPEEQKAAEPVTADPAPAPEITAEPTPTQEQAGPAQPAPGDVVISADQIDELMAKKRQAARAEIEKEALLLQRRPGLLRRNIRLLALRSPKSRAGAVRPKRKKRSRPRRVPRKSRKRQSPARAAHPRRIRRPPARPSRHNETKCPEVEVVN